MFRIRLPRFASLTALSLGAAVLLGGGCGGGGGGGGGDGCELPGSLTAIALEGGAAPDTGGGSYGFFVTNTKISVASGGWTVFQADVVTPGGSTAAVFVTPPTLPTRLVFRQGDAVPAPGSGTIDTFLRVWATEDGIVVAHVTIGGGGTNTFGILTARVDGAGDVVEKTGAIYDGATLPTASGAPASPGALLGIEADLTQVADDGRIFFVGHGATATGLFAVSRTGTGLVAAAQEGQDAVGFDPGETIGSNFQVVGIDEDGLLLGYVVEVVPSGAEAVYANNLSTVSLVASDGDTLAGVGGRTLEQPYVAGPLIVALSSGVGIFVWEGELSGADPNDVILLRQVSPSLGTLSVMAAGGQTAPGGGAGATFGSLSLLDSQIDAVAATLRAQVLGGVTTEIFYDLPGLGTFAELWRQGEDAPGAGPGDFTTSYPSLSVANQVDSDAQGSAAVTALLSDATSGVFWAIRGCGFFSVVKAGDPAPGGGTFDSFGAPSSLALVPGTLVFRSGILGSPGSASGLFRRQ